MERYASGAMIVPNMENAFGVLGRILLSDPYVCMGDLQK